MMVLHPLGLPKLLLLPKRFRIQLGLLRRLCGAFVTRLRDFSCARLYLEPGPSFSANLVTTDTVFVDNPDGGSSMKRAEDG
jgi:hypothetical protein